MMELSIGESMMTHSATFKQIASVTVGEVHLLFMYTSSNTKTDWQTNSFYTTCSNLQQQINGTKSTSVVIVNRINTETATFCYLRASSSPRCFRPKTARFLCVFSFFYCTL